MSNAQADQTARSDESAGGKDGILDRWVRDRPLWTFGFVAGAATLIFLMVYALVGNPRVKLGFPLDDAVTGYVGALATTAVALAGALVSVMLARLALRLGYRATAAADQANQIQEQMRKFADPAFVETRDGHKVAAELDLLGTLLCVYAGEVFASSASERPIEPIRHTYGRGNDLVSNPALYRYCAQLIGPAEATIRFASAQARIYEARRMLGPDGGPGRDDAITTARNAERIAIEIAHMSRALERAKQAVLSNPGHHLHPLARDLKWERPENSVSGCESTARRLLLETAVVRTPLDVRTLLQPGARSVVHVLETDLQDLFRALGSPTQAAKVLPEGAQVVRHDNLRDFVAAGHESRMGTCADVIVAGWDSTLKDEPEAVTYEELYRPWDQVAPAGIGLESATLWGKATFLARNPAIERAVAEALGDLAFLRAMTLRDVSDDLYHRQGIDPADAGDDVLEQNRHAAARSARRLGYIHAAIEDLRRIHDAQGAVVVADRNPYEALGREDSTRAVIVIRPCFARIDMSLPGSEWERKDEWFQRLLGGYTHYRWDGSAA